MLSQQLGNFLSEFYVYMPGKLNKTSIIATQKRQHI